MDKKLKAKWVKALTSGKFKQGTKVLKRGERYCCLGVLRCLLQKRIRELPQSDRYIELLNPEQQRAAGLRKKNQSILARKNDNGMTFAQIADYIKARL